MAIFCRRWRSWAGVRDCISVPSMTTWPSVGRSSRLMQRTRVLLPAPDIPMMP